MAVTAPSGATHPGGPGVLPYWGTAREGILKEG